MGTLFQAATLQIDADEAGVALLKIDVPERSVNVITPAFLTDLNAALDSLTAARVHILAIRSKKPSGFIAGADIAEFTKIQTQADAVALSQRGQELFNKLASLPLPTLAIIHGPCLGGGLELALACDYRLVVDMPTTQLGLPEIELGLLPGWGGTQRLPRIIGLQRALQVILNRKRLNAKEAVEWGLADAVAQTEKEQRELLERLIFVGVGKGKQRRTSLPLRTLREKALESTGVGRKLIFHLAARNIARSAPDDYPAPTEALDAIRIGLKDGIDAGFQREREAAGRLASSSASRNLVQLFLRNEKARKLPAEWKSLPIKPIQRVGIVGAGAMGAGIAQLALLRGCQVVIQEVSDEALRMGLFQIDELVRKALARGIINEEHYVKAVQNRSGTTTWEGFAQVDAVVEAIVENLEIKRKLFRELEEKTSPDAILASNTSSLLIADIQAGLQHPGRVAGLHFFNPVHKLPLVEVVQAATTQIETIQRLTQWALTLGKTPIRVKDSPGFVVNRILMPYVNEAVLMVAEGYGIDEVDHIMKRFGMPMGPLEMLDQIGLDVAAHVADSMQPRLGERFAPNPVFRRMSESGWLGQKKRAGFYYHRGNRKRVNKDVLPLLRENASPRPITGDRATQARDRLVKLMVEEARRCLAEGLTSTAEEIDLAMILGTGWAPHRGGPLRYGEERGW